MPLPKRDPKELNIPFLEYMKGKRILIADEDSVTRSSIAATLIQIGIATPQLILCSNYDQASSAISQQRPEVVLCDFMLGKRSGIELLQEQRRNVPDTEKSLFILVTANTSQAGVAQAAEEDVDAYILKPFTIETLKKIIINTALLKAYPSDYQVKIRAGKTKLDQGKISDAIELFTQAAALSPRPTLALFYTGHSHFTEKSYDVAQKNFEEGLALNKIHYKCMVGMFETYQLQNRKPEAYEIVKKIVRYFPANPKRLASVLKLAIETQSYDDIERYYQNFLELDLRSPELVIYICAALVVCAKFYLSQNYASRAIALMEKAVVTSARQPRILREVITDLMRYGHIKEAKDLLVYFNAEDQNTVEYHAMKALVQSTSVDTGITIARCRELIQKNVHDPVLYELLIAKSMESGLKVSADDYFSKAVTLWPMEKSRFEEAMKTVEKPRKAVA